MPISPQVQKSLLSSDGQGGIRTLIDIPGAFRKKPGQAGLVNNPYQVPLFAFPGRPESLRLQTRPCIRRERNDAAIWPLPAMECPLIRCWGCYRPSEPHRGTHVYHARFFTRPGFPFNRTRPKTLAVPGMSGCRVRLRHPHAERMCNLPTLSVDPLLGQTMVHPRGFEPPPLAGQEPESCVYANFTTGAKQLFPLERHF